MPDEGTDGGDDDVVLVNFRVTQRFLDQVDTTWQDRGFNSRSEFIRYALRKAAEPPVFDREELLALLNAESELHRSTVEESTEDGK